MYNSVVICLCPFTGVGIPGYKGDKWFEKRIELFKRYTLESLVNQTDKNFILWITFRSEEKDNYLTQGLEAYIKGTGIRVVFTFDGLPYHDDKYGGSLGQKLWNIARVARQAYRSKDWSLLKTISLVCTDKNETLPERVERSLTIIAEQVGKADTVFLSRIDSDDMFHQDYFALVRQSKKDAIVCTGGYVYNHTTGELAKWEPKTNPPFHTLVFRNGTFWNAHCAQYRGYRSHEDIPKLFTVDVLEGRMYCVLTHDPLLHLSTTWTHTYKGDAVFEGKERILSYFGICTLSK